MTSALSSAKSPAKWPSKWIDGTHADEPTIQSWAYDARTTIFRQSLLTHFEAPFMVLLCGEERALLMDTGTGDIDVRAHIESILPSHIEQLIVAHSHSHSDHVGGDKQFVSRERTTIIGHSPSEVRQAFALGSDDTATIDLGDRVLDIVFIPGHEASHVAFYDRQSRLLLSGDSLYPGRLTVRDWTAWRSSIKRLVDFLDADEQRVVEHIVGAHIELDANDLEYEEEVRAHPNEHALPLGMTELRDLLTTTESLGTHPIRTKRPHFVVVPML